ncbi:MAG: hypothetical protein HY430_02925 [Candidatus Levybacteria bacterium]|nr:hypothetical protein [Candidatus Levybacteria bacterium]
METLDLSFEHILYNHEEAKMPKWKFEEKLSDEKYELSQPARIYDRNYFLYHGFTPKTIHFNGKPSVEYLCKGDDGILLDENQRIIEHRIGKEHPIFGNDHIIEYEYDEDGYLAREEERQAGFGGLRYETRYVYTYDMYGFKELDKMIMQPFSSGPMNTRGLDKGLPQVIDFSDVKPTIHLTQWERDTFAL